MQSSCRGIGQISKISQVATVVLITNITQTHLLKVVVQLTIYLIMSYTGFLEWKGYLFVSFINHTNNIGTVIK